ncbi:MAG: class I SAM-dependent methyltransferase [Planctomycetaceae bacterium]|nr:class I SAM-dependent methyltransferase [Planctomycetaceae bacterium]
MFDDLADVYEAMIDWPKRLAYEASFYRRLFDEAGVRRVLDMACGTGHHAAMFHAWGLSVESADVSPAMIERARASFGSSDGLRWVVRAFDRPVDNREPFDAAICVGNSLALAADRATVERAVRQMVAAVRAGGIVIIHVLNLWRLADGPCQWQKCQRLTLPSASETPRDALIVKGVHRCGGRGFLELVVADPATGRLLRSESTPLLGIEASDVTRIAIDAGAKSVDLFGGYRNEPFDCNKSVDLVLVARR